MLNRCGGTVRASAYSLAMRRLRPLTEAECYARCYGGWEETVRIVRLEPRLSRRELAVEGEALRMRFEEFLDARDPEALAEPEAA
jgi:hypothetical protein